MSPTHTLAVRSHAILLYFLVYGRNIPALVEQPLEEEKLHPGKNTVTYEARLLKSLFLKLK
jgi:tetratricopeptide repeat protein 30